MKPLISVIIIYLISFSVFSSVNSRKIEKAKKIEECNIKIPYLNFVLLGAVAFVIQFVGVLIARI